MNPLQLFYNNEIEREAVKAFMFAILRENAADKALDGEDTSGFVDAKECVQKTFDKLDELYGRIKPPKPSNTR